MMTNKVVWSGLSKAVQLNIQNGTYKEAILLGSYNSS